MDLLEVLSKYSRTSTSTNYLWNKSAYFSLPDSEIPLASIRAFKASHGLPLNLALCFETSPASSNKFCTDTHCQETAAPRQLHETVLQEDFSK